jgi:hypothetical protein
MAGFYYYSCTGDKSEEGWRASTPCLLEIKVRKDGGLLLLLVYWR